MNLKKCLNIYISSNIYDFLKIIFLYTLAQSGSQLDKIYMEVEVHGITKKR